MSKTNNNSVHGIKRVVIISVIMIIVTSLFIAYFCMYKSFNTHLSHDADYVTALNLQMTESVKSYFNKFEDTSKILFSQKEYMTYDATADIKDNYNVTQTEKNLSDYLSSLSLMDNYADFGIIYRNNHTVGNISDGTLDLYGEDSFGEIEKCLGNNKTLWYGGYNGDNKKMFYFRRVNKNSIFVSSFYITNFKKLFITPLQMQDITVLILDKSGKVVFNSDENQKETERDFSTLFSSNDNCTVIDGNIIASVNSAVENGWQIITYKDIENLYVSLRNVAVVSGGICLFAIILFLFISFIAVSDSVSGENSFVNGELNPVDNLTGLNEYEYVENLIVDKIETCINGSTILLLLVSVKNYELIKENYNVDTANESIIRTARILADFYDGENNIVGKTGENQFIVFADFTESDLFDAHKKINSNLEQLSNKLKEVQLDNNRGYLHYGIGATIYPDSSMDYDDLYSMAESALKKSLANKEDEYVLETGSETLTKSFSTGKENG